jgi:hypothetical protein
MTQAATVMISVPRLNFPLLALDRWQLSRSFRQNQNDTSEKLTVSFEFPEPLINGIRCRIVVLQKLPLIAVLEHIYYPKKFFQCLNESGNQIDWKANLGYPPSIY